MRYIEPNLLERANKWLTPFFDNETQLTIKELIAYDTETLEDSFYKDLEFGTGGMRGIMGVGDNRINKYTLGKNTQGLSNYLKKVFGKHGLKVAIAYDCRHNSKSLAKVVADVFSANGIHVYLFSDLRPTPELSFAVRYLDCHCGIVLTASHNPPEYNGYKVYWQDGGPLVPPQDSEIIKEITALQYTDICFEAKENRITYIDKEVDEAFINASIQNGSFDTLEEAKNELKIVFTPLHGTSITLLPEVLKNAGYNHLSIVKDQAQPDGDFPTVTSPNPEEPEALAMALKMAEEEGADMVIGTDPDSDRLGIAVRNKEGKLVLLNGNQAMVLKTHFLLEKWRKEGRLDGKQFVASTIVSTPMVQKIAEDFGVIYKEGLTGFKWIAKMVKDHPELTLIGGGEESFGFMVGDFVRDKDAITSSLLACEIAAQKKAEGGSMYDYLYQLYAKYGYYQESLVSFVKKGKKGAEEIQEMMRELRERSPLSLAGSKIVRVEDYQKSTSLNLNLGKTEHLEMPKSNVLIFYTEDGDKIAARPSGTEPKIKFYISVNGSNPNLLESKINAIKKDLNLVE